MVFEFVRQLIFENNFFSKPDRPKPEATWFEPKMVKTPVINSKRLIKERLGVLDDGGEILSHKYKKVEHYKGLRNDLQAQGLLVGSPTIWSGSVVLSGAVRMFNPMLDFGSGMVVYQ